MELFTVPTIAMKVLFVFIVLEHRRREELQFHVTEHPTTAWTSQQWLRIEPHPRITRKLRRWRHFRQNFYAACRHV
jgi:hypothetical protein